MTVLLTVSETLDGSAVSDSLAAGGTGVDLGSVVNNQFAPLTDKTANTGSQLLYVRHDATVDPITEVGTFIESYAATGFTYGGANSAAGDFTALKALGFGSGSSKNNADGLSGGLWVDMDAAASTTNQFDQATFPTKVKIYGDGSGSSTDGIDLASAFTVKSTAMVIAPADTLATTPVDGVIGKDGDTVKGDNAKLKLRIYLPLAQLEGGIHQWSWTVKYSFTA